MESCESRSICNPFLIMQSIDRRTESSFCGVYYYGLGPVPYALKVVRNAKEQDQDQDQELRMETNFDCYCCATTTAITLLKQILQLHNLGARGAVLGTRDENNALIPVRLTGYNKPAARKCRGRRVKPEVVLSAPFISIRRITNADEFVVLATSGVWEVLKKKEVVDIVYNCPRRSGAARAVVDAAVRKWSYKYPTSMVDDCAVVCLFLHPLPEPHVVTSNKINSNILSLGKKKRD